MIGAVGRLFRPGALVDSLNGVYLIMILGPVFRLFTCSTVAGAAFCFRARLLGSGIVRGPCQEKAVSKVHKMRAGKGCGVPCSVQTIEPTVPRLLILYLADLCLSGLPADGLADLDVQAPVCRVDDAEAGMMEPLGARQLFDLYMMMPVEEQRAFIRLLGTVSTAAVPFLLVSSFGPTAQHEFATLLVQKYSQDILPIVHLEARKLARERSDVGDEEFEQILRKRVQSVVNDQAREIASLEKERVKRQRDRQSDPEIVRRNVEICDLRQKDAKVWTQGRLAKKYDVTPRAIRLILKDEPKWRRLQAQLGIN